MCSRAVAPARVNLIGEHTDYTGGFILPMAIQFSTEARVLASQTDEYVFRSCTFPGERRMGRSDRGNRRQDWSDYPVGVLRELQKLGIEPPPFELELGGNVPLGAGLSSSASVEVATCLALLSWSATTLPSNEIALLCQRAENLYVGSPCGIMDQFVITLAEAGHALLVRTHDLHHESVPMNRGALSDCRIVVCNSGVKHSIATGSYGYRRQELEAGQAVLQEKFGIRDLGQATLDHLNQMKHAMTEASYKRCRHVISENARVQASLAAMCAGDAVTLGELITAAHVSERDDFECSCEEIDFLVERAIALPGCHGARLTGGGFGGCTVNLVAKENVTDFVVSLRASYQEYSGTVAEMYVCEAVDGAIACNQFALAGGRR